MRTTVLKSHGLSVLAARIRDRFKDEFENELDELFDDLEQPPRMDARGRKWAAQKLLEPKDPTAVDDEYDVEFELEVLQEYWKLVTGTSWNTSMSPEQANRIASQYGHTKAYVGACWNLEGVEAPPEEEEEPEPTGYDPVLLKFPDKDDEEDIDIELDDDDEIDLEYLYEKYGASSDDEEQDPSPEGEDADEVSDEEEQASAQALLDDAGVSDSEPTEIPF